jgi:hypothetical protein
MVLAQRPQLGKNEPFGRTQVRALFLTKFWSIPKEMVHASEMEHWQLNELESIDTFPLDYRITQTL